MVNDGIEGDLGYSHCLVLLKQISQTQLHNKTALALQAYKLLGDQNSTFQTVSAVEVVKPNILVNPSE